MAEAEIDVKTLAKRIEQGKTTYLLDVREPWEHKFAALPGSVLVPLGQLQQRVHEVRPPDGALLVVYCHHGMRSLQAAMWLREAGFPEAVSLAGGIDEWSDRIDLRLPRY